MNNTNNKTIAKNTLYLYARQIVSLIISFFTAGIMLNTLGEIDYGVFNVVGGIIGMVSFLTGTLASGSQRFIAYDIAIGDKEQIQRTFCTIALSYYIMGTIIILLSETIGVWFLNTHMNIPQERMYAANWVLQCTIIQFAIGLINSGYSSAVIAYEKMTIFAYVDILNLFIRLVVLFLIVVSPYDKLISLCLIYLFISVGQTFFYRWYCVKKLNGLKFKLIWDSKKMKEIFSFSGWNTIGSVATILHTNGVNILLNLFFNPAINAARGIAYNLNSMISSFVSNFTVAVKPQITKTYSSGDMGRMHKLIYSGSRLSFYLMLIMCIPVSLNIDQILIIWLKNPPAYTATFVQYVLLFTLLEIYSAPLTAGIQATGNIKLLQLTVSVLYLLIVPISYVLLKNGCPPESPLWVNIFIVILCLFPRLYLCQKQYGLSMYEYFFNVVVRTILVASISYLICWFEVKYISDGKSFLLMLLACIASFLTTCIVAFFGGMIKSEQELIIAYIRKKVRCL